MHNLRRWYYDNRDKIWLAILVIGFILFCINIFNNIYKNKPKEENNKNTVSIKNTINNEITGELSSGTSIIAGTAKDTDTLQRDTKVIDDFIKNCNNGNIEEAYDLLTVQCKEELFPTIEGFKNNYYRHVFATQKTYSVQNWIKNTYKVMMKEDVLATGKAGSDAPHLQEYMTIESTDDGYKLNISDYIGRTIKNKINTKDEVEVTIIKKETYMDYEEYTIKVKNLTNNELILDNGEEIDRIYLQDENGIKEYVDTVSFDYRDLNILPGISRTYTFKFYNTYSTTRVIQYLVFEQAIVQDEEGNIEYRKIMINV